MVCTFFGHRDAPDSIKEAVLDKIVSLMLQENVKTFYVGNNGNFDFLVQSLLFELKKEYKDINYSIVLSRVDEKVKTEQQLETLFPEELDKTPSRYAISKRNDWLIKNSQFLITYTKRKFSNCYKLIETASKRGLKIINISDFEFI